jgi:hypothetical protein
MSFSALCQWLGAARMSMMVFMACSWVWARKPDEDRRLDWWRGLFRIDRGFAV